MLLDLFSGRHREPAECVLRLGASREEINDLYPVLTEVVVETSRREAAVATLRFESRRDETGRWLVQDDERIATWQPVVIEAAFGSYTEEVFCGYIRELRVEYPEDPGTAAMTVECQDGSLALDREHVRRAWGAETPTSDTAIVSEIVVQRHNLVLDPESGQGQNGLTLHQDGTDIRFLRSRAEANAYELIFSGDRVYFGPMRLGAEPQETILVYAGTDTHCFRFSVRADGHRPDRVAFDLADATGNGITRRVVEPDLPLLGATPADSRSSDLDEFTWFMTRHGSGNEEELAARAQSHANENAMRIRAEGDLDGSRYGHVLRVGEPVGVDGVGRRLAGIYYSDSVRHRFDVDGYRQTFTLLRNAYGENLPTAGGGHLAALP